MKTQWNTLNNVAIFNAYGVAMYSIGKKYNDVADICKGYYTVIESDRKALSEYAMGEYNGTRKVEDVRKDLEDMLTKVVKFEKERDEYKATFDKSVEECEKLFADLYKAYETRMEDIDAYAKAITDLFATMGVKLTESTCKVIMTKVGDNVDSFRAIGKKIGKEVKGKAVANSGLKNVTKAKFCTIMARTVNELRGFDYTKAIALENK